jgi:N-acetylneuraminic acid mutarotase
VVNTVEIADIQPTGRLGSWSTSATLPYTVYNHGSFVYNDRLYIVGGASSVGGAPLSTVYFNKINSSGTLNSWIQTTSMGSGRMSNGGTFTTVWGAYLYTSGGCGTVNASGYCTSILSDSDVASINADGSIDTWNAIGALNDQRTGQSLLAWRNTIYHVGGCTAQNTTTGACTTPTNAVSYGTINQDGDASTVGQSVASGTAPCNGASPSGCNLPGTTYIGNMLTISFISNGYLYLIGGCTNNTCSTTLNTTAYVAISSTGTMSKPTTCPSPRTIQGGMWCVDTTNTTPTNVAAGSPVVFNGRIYIVGGLDGSANTNDLLRADINQADGSLGTWSTQTLTGLGVNSVSYLYSFARANPTDATNNPGNLYILGGCSSSSSAGCTAYSQNVYKCNIQAAGTIASCATTGQQQIGIIPGDTATGLGIMSGTVYANYIYLIGGVSPNLVDLKTVRYAKIDSSNNIVAVSGSAWIESAYQMAVGRRRSAAFGYNGYLYVVGGYEASTGVLADIEFIKINVSDGSLVSEWTVSAVQINQRWGLTVPISNSFAYVIGGCTAGASPGGCTTRTDVIQTFQIYNNDSGTPARYSNAANTYATGPNRLGVSSVVANGYLYVAGGCTGTSDCASPTADVSYAQLDAYGNIGSWTSTASLPGARAWGKLLVAGGSLYYVGGQDTNGASQSTIYYATPSTGSIPSWSTATTSLPASRTQFGAAVWNNRLYVVAGNTGTANQVIYNTAGTASYTVPTGISSLTVKAWGAGGGGGGGSGSTGAGGSGGGGGFSQSTITVTPGETLTVNVGTAGKATGSGGGGGGFSALLRSTTYLLQAGGGGGGGGAFGTAAGGNGGPGGGASAAAGNGTAGGGTGGGGFGGGGFTTGGTGGTAGTTGTAGNSGAANLGGDAGGSAATCPTAVTTRGGNGGTGAGGSGGSAVICVGGGGGGGGAFGGGGGGSAASGTNRGSGGGGGGSSIGTTQTVASGTTPGNSTDATRGNAGVGGTGTTAATGTNGTDGTVVIGYGSYTDTATVYVSPQLNSGGDITSAWSTASTSINVARSGAAVVAYANNLYVFGGFDGTNYLSDVQYAQIDSGAVTPANAGLITGNWTYSTSLPKSLSQADAVAANGYIYLVGGRNTATTCDPSTLIAPVSANTTISSGNNPTGVGDWSATNQRYTGSRYGAAAAYYDGKLYVLGGGCGATVTYPASANTVQQTALLSQPQVAKYSIMIDTDSDVFPNAWLLNGVDNSIGARWQLKYRSMANQNITAANRCATMTTWGSETNFGNVTLGLPGAYIVKDGGGTDIKCGRYFFFNTTIDSSQAFGYPDDVSRGPTITDLTLQFTADPGKRLMHGRTFTGGLQMPDDTPYYTN